MTSSNGETSVRRLAGEILLKVDARKAYADILLDQCLRDSALGERDRSLLTELTYGTLRWRGKIDAVLSRQLRRPLADTEPFIRNLLRATVYQLLFLDRIPDYAAVNEAVEVAKAHGGSAAAGFVNGVLRNLLRQRDKAAMTQSTDDYIAVLSVEYSHPEWLAKRWLEYYGREHAKALMRANNERAPLVLRANTRKITSEELQALLAKNGISAVSTRWSPQGIRVQSGATSVDRLPGFSEGLFQVQGEASQLVANILSPRAGERILDACAAPGGKTTHIAELMGDRGELIATDRSARGIDRIRENCARLGLRTIRAMHADVSRELSASLRGPYDRILLDAPCSGLGTLRSHPEIKWHREESDILRLSRLQSKMVNRVAGYLKPDGVLVYSTCTLTREENEQLMERFLEQHEEFELENAAGYLPEQAQHMVQDRYFVALPHRDDTDGFFAARMRKVT